MTPQLIRITEIYDDGEASRHFTFEPVSGIRHSARPGQFFTLAIPGHGEAAFTYLSLPDAQGRFKALIRKVGSLTSALFQCNHGDLIGFRGPFGNSWPLEQLKDRRVLIIAGGIGLPPLAAVINQLSTKESTPVGLIYGSRSPADQVLKQERLAWHTCMPILETFDHPSSRQQLTGTPLDHIQQMTAKLGGSPEAVLACGPEVMMNAAAQHFIQNGLPPEEIWLALERRMHCGVGECGHCYLGSSTVCADGPIYSWQQLIRLQSQTTA
ncbi:MAG: FAD/NAD(P)-binding protein [Candidatus Polarisedimenticolaceae bacterium]|nr:FAD/NAD(P)-binding protein [Candidatus Polarisedimenticolaceae bacterium]